MVSEFLVMAATLLDIKARMLLPREVSEEGEEEDPRAELVERLLEYKTYKYMSLELKDMEVDADKVFYKEMCIRDRFTSFEGNTGPYILYTIARINSILKKYEAVCGTPKDPVILPPEAEPEKTLMLALSRFSEVMEAGFEAVSYTHLYPVWEDCVGQW